LLESSGANDFRITDPSGNGMTLNDCIAPVLVIPPSIASSRKRNFVQPRGGRFAQVFVLMT
jgi:hypothetical protein